MSIANSLNGINTNLRCQTELLSHINETNISAHTELKIEQKQMRGGMMKIVWALLSILAVVAIGKEIVPFFFH